MGETFVRKERKWQPRELSELHHHILRLHMLGYRQQEIANKMGCTLATVSNALNCNLGRFHTSLIRSELDGTAVEAAKRIRELAPKAVQLIEDIMADEAAPTSVRLRAAQDALDRAGLGAVKKVDMRTASVSLTKDDIEDLKSTAMERAKACGLIVEDAQDITPTPLPTSSGVQE